MSTRILVTGDRRWTNQETVRDALVEAVNDYRHSYPCVLVVGDCPTGADQMATELWEHWRSIHSDWFAEPKPFEAKWKQLGHHAGPARNSEMVASGADVCLAFLTPLSRGTVDCAGKARAAGIPVRWFHGDAS